MSSSKILSHQELTFLLNNTQHLKARHSTNNAFYKQFVIDTAQHIEGIDKDYFLSILNANTVNSFRPITDYCADFIEHFQNRISIPETYTLFHLFNQSYQTIHTNSFNALYSFLDNEIGEDGILKMLEDYLSEFECYEPRLTKYWLKLSVKHKNLVNSDKCIKIVLKLLKTPVITTSKRNFILNCLTFANNYGNIKEHLIKFIESNQDDSVFIRHAEKLKEKIKDLNWNEKTIPEIYGKKITGNIELNAEYFIKTYKFTRGESEKFIKAFLNYFSYEFKSTYSHCSIIISGESIEDYARKETFFMQTFEKAKLLPPHWDKNNTVTENNYFFKNYIEKISLYNNLNENILDPKESGHTSQKRHNGKI